MGPAPFNPLINEALTKAPEVVYSLTVPSGKFVTNRSEPSTAMSNPSVTPVISEAFTTAPEVVYSPIVPPGLLRTNRSEPEIARL